MMLIAPGAIAFLLTKRFAVMLGLSVAIAVSASLLGIYASFWLDSAPAPTIVLILTAMFLLAMSAGQRTGSRDQTTGAGKPGADAEPAPAGQAAE